MAGSACLAEQTVWELPQGSSVIREEDFTEHGVHILSDSKLSPSYYTIWRGRRKRRRHIAPQPL